MDYDGDGEITITEFANFMSSDGISYKEAKALFNSVDENGDGTMDQMEFITLMESKHPLLKKVPWAVALGAGFSAGEADDEIVWVDPEARPWFMLSPHDNLRVSWDTVTAILLVYVAIIEPLRMGFQISPPAGSFIYAMDLICDGFFVADFFLNFRTGYVRHDTGTLDMNPRRSAMVYLRSWALLDFVSSIPPILELLLGTAMNALRSAKILKLGRVAKLGKMFRLVKFMRFGQDSAVGEFVEDFFASSRSKALRRIFQVLLAFAILAHYLGCFFALAGKAHLQNYSPGLQKADGSGADTWSVRAQYLASVYWAVTTMTTVGYGDMYPVTDKERVYTMIAMIFGGFFYGYVVAQTTLIVKAYDAQRGPYYAKMDRVHSWLNYHEVPLHVRRQVRRYYRTYFSHRTAFDEREIVDDLDPDSQQKIADHVLPSCIRHNELFGVLPKGATCKLLHVIRLLRYDAGEIVVSEGESSSTMFVVYSGKLKSRRSLDLAGNVIQPVEETLLPGASWGEKAVLGISSRSALTARALTPIKLYAITQNDFMGAFITLPEALLAMRHTLDPKDGLIAPVPSSFSHLQLDPSAALTSSPARGRSGVVAGEAGAGHTNRVAPAPLG